MNFVIAAKAIQAELTDGSQYPVYGKTVNGAIVLNETDFIAGYPVYGNLKNGVIVLNDSGLLMVYKEENFT